MSKSFLFPATSVINIIQRFSGFLFILPFILLQGYSQSTNEILVGAIRENLYHLMIDDGVLSGTGASLIQESIPGSQFLLVGEQHGIAEPTIFTDALFREAMQHHYRYLCIETDPFIASALESAIGHSRDSVIALLKNFPKSVPFYGTHEDLRLLQTVVGLSPAQYSVLWGVDQVFMGTPRFLFYRLAELAPDYNARQLALSYFEKSQEAYRDVAQTGDFSKFIILQLKDDDFEKLYEAFGKNFSKEAVRMIYGLQESQAIYFLWLQGRQYENNYTRVRLLKRQFLDYYRQALLSEELPRVLFRFGLTHTMRGLSMYDQYDLGNLAYELAEMNEMKAVNFRITGIKGSAQGIMGPPVPFDNTGSIHPIILQSIEEHTPNLGWILLDFRPLRHLQPNIIQPVREFIHSYDFWILVPDAKPVTYL
jgi:hypothetical protein